MKLRKPILYLCMLSLFHLGITGQIPGIYNMNEYVPILKNKNIAVVVNHSSIINDKHLVDTLIKLDLNLKVIFSPEHGFYGSFNAGEYVSDSLYDGSIPIISLYGKNKELKNAYLEDVDIVVFDIQDVGVRFYTYISTLHYVMEGCARNSLELIVLDRPNPHVNYVDGPVLENEYTSFVGMHPVPIVYGMTIGEYALMINGEGWLADNLKSNLRIVKNIKYSRSSVLDFITAPSPNLRTMNAIFLYPSLCLFEGTSISVGRGTDFPFEVYGSPFFKTQFSFTPISNSGSKYPKYENQLCYGFDLSDTTVTNRHPHKDKINIDYLIRAYSLTPLKHRSSFFNPFFNNLAGNSSLKEDIINRVSERKIRASWKKDIDVFLLLRKKYLLYH